MAQNMEKTVVVVEDDDSLRLYLQEVIAAQGYDCVCFPDGAAALNHLSESAPPDLLLSDINMPGMSGLELLRIVRAIDPSLPFILISGLYNLSSALSALRVGATDYLLKPARPDEILKVLNRNIETIGQPHQQAVRLALGDYLNARRVSGGQSARQLIPLFDMLGFKRFETFQHSQRVAGYALLLGQKIEMSTNQLDTLEIGSLLHDIGKAAIPHNVIMKPCKLTESEWRVMKLHPQLGWELLTDLPGLAAEADIVYSHHERFDGKGYPRGLSGEDICIGARIFAVADTLDAMTSDRCYRKGQPTEAARIEIEKMCNTQFDPRVVECLRATSDAEILRVRTAHPDEALPSPTDSNGDNA